MSHKKAVEKWPETRAPARNGRVVFEVMESWARLENRPKGWDKAMVPINREWTRVLNGQQSIGELINIAKPEAEGILKQEATSRVCSPGGCAPRPGRQANAPVALRGEGAGRSASEDGQIRGVVPRHLRQRHLRIEQGAGAGGALPGLPAAGGDDRPLAGGEVPVVVVEEAPRPALPAAPRRRSRSWAVKGSPSWGLRPASTQGQTRSGSPKAAAPAPSPAPPPGRRTPGGSPRSKSREGGDPRELDPEQGADHLQRARSLRPVFHSHSVCT